MNTRVRQTIIAALLLGFLFLPPLAGLLNWQDRPPLTEKRTRAPRPAWPGTAAELAQFPRRFEAYYNDHFGLRATLIRGYNYVKVFWVRSSPTDSVLLGKKGWVFYWDQQERDSYRRLPPFSLKEEWLWRGYLRLWKDWLGSRNIRWIVVIAPNKGTVYPEYMPANIFRGAGPSKLDRLVALAGQEGISLMDIRPDLLQAKKNKPVFFRYDTHWNDAGAYRAYRKIMQELGPCFPQIPTIRESDLVAQDRPEADWKDLAFMLGLPRHLREPDQRLFFNIPRQFRSPFFENLRTLTNDAVFDTGRPDLPDALLFRDSFGIALIPFLAQHFNKFRITERQALLPEIIDRERPAAVIIEVLERFLEQETLFLTMVQQILKREYGIDWLAAVDLPAKVGLNEPSTESFWGKVRKASRGRTPAGTLMFGPYTDLKPGNYWAHFRLKGSGIPGQGPWAKIDVSAGRGKEVLKEKKLYGSDFQTPGPWQTFTLSFTVRPDNRTGVEYRVEYFGGADLAVEGVRVVPQEKSAWLDRIFPP
jgi:hypothetical protein